MKKNKLLTTLAIASVVFIAGCNCNDEERWSDYPDNDENSGDYGSGTSGQLAKGAVNLGTAGNFVILSESGITDVSTSVITGDIGTSPITGAAITVTDGDICDEVTGTIYTVDDAGPACRVIDPDLLDAAVLNMRAAYNWAAGRVPGVGATNLNVGAGTLNGQTFAPGTYTWNTPGNVNITGNITLSGGANAVWIFQVAGTLTVLPDVKIILSGGAQAKNIFWQVAGVVALQERSHFEGTILAKTNITLTLGASVNGRLLAQTAVTLIGNTVTFSGTSGGGTNPGHDGDGCKKDKKDKHGDYGDRNGCKDNDDNGNHYGWKDNDDNDNRNGKDKNDNRNGKDKNDNRNGKDKNDDNGRNKGYGRN